MSSYQTTILHDKSRGFQRSRTGCFTCRRRKRKCPEQYNHDGECQACTVSGYQCLRDRPLDRDEVIPVRSRGVSQAYTALELGSFAPQTMKRRSEWNQGRFGPCFAQTDTMQQRAQLLSGSHANNVSSMRNTPTGPGITAPRMPETSTSFIETDLETFNAFPELFARMRDVMQVDAEGASERAYMPAQSDLPDLHRSRTPEPQQHEFEKRFLDIFLCSLSPAIRIPIERELDGTKETATDLIKASSMAVYMLFRSKLAQTGHPGLDEDVQKRSDDLQESYGFYLQALMSESRFDPFSWRVSLIPIVLRIEVTQNGAAAGYAVFDVMETVIIAALGSPPILDLRLPSSLLQFLLLSVFFGTTILGVCAELKPSFLRIRRHNASTPIAGSMEEAVQAVWGIPLPVLLAIDDTNRLSVEESDLDRADFQQRRTNIESTLLNYRGLNLAARQLNNSHEILDELTTHVMWRHTALIHLYQTLFRFGPCQPAIQRSVKQIIRRGSESAAAHTSLKRAFPQTSDEPNQLTDHVPGGLQNDRACCWFIAGTVALLPEDRIAVRHFAKLVKPMRLAQDNLDALEKLWSLTDERGWPMEWRKTLLDENHRITFC